MMLSGMIFGIIYALLTYSKWIFCTRNIRIYLTGKGVGVERIVNGGDQGLYEQATVAKKIILK